MIIHQNEQRLEQRDNMRDGNGRIGIRHIIEEEQSTGAGRLFAVMTIPPGASIGLHTHDKDFEIYYILKGTAHVTDNGIQGVLHVGDSMLCKRGDNHSIENRGYEDIEFVALVLYGK